MLCAGVVLAAAAPCVFGQGLGIDLSGGQSDKTDPKLKKKQPAPATKPAAKPAEPPKKQPEQKPPEKVQPVKKPAEPTAVKGLDVSGKSATKQRLAGAKKLFSDKNYETAALAYSEILRDTGLADGHDEARYQLAKCLAKLGLYHSALSKFGEILGKGSEGSKYFYTSLEWLFYIGKRMVNEKGILTQVARFSNERFPPAYEDKFHYLLAKYAYERGKALGEAGQVSEAKKSYDEARRMAGTVRAPSGGKPIPAAGVEGEEDVESTNVYARGKFVEGLVFYALGDKEQALESFKEVVRITNPKRTRVPDEKVREQAFLQLARIHYEAKQNRYAIFYYSKMPWGEPNWLEGLWEASYAHYRIGDYERSLGNLITLHSPYFREDYFPESHILKAIIYFENCRYREARAILEDFNSTFEPIHAELTRITGKSGTPASYFEEIERAAKSKDMGRYAMSMRKVMKIALTDQNVRALNESIVEVEKEMDDGIGSRRDAFRYSALAKELGEALKTERRKMVDEAGARARQKLEYERDALRGLLQQALRIKIEVSRKEREALESSIAAGGKIDVVRDYKYSVAVSDEHLYWPYEGEFWRDELGTYSYTLTKGCRENLTTRAEKAR
jgi:tetratricopeptide (TPR) repeat protein